MTKLELYENFSKNIELERARMGYTQQRMADALGISLSKYKILITNPIESNVDMFLAHKLYKVTGKTARELCEDHIPEVDILMWFRDLPAHRKEALKYLIEIEHQFPHDSGPGNERDFVSVFIPTGNMEDGMYLDSTYLDSVNIAEFKKNCCEKIDCGVKITSNHLHPVYHTGDILLVSKRAPRDGDTGIFIRKDNRRMFIREFKQTQPCELRPVNGYGDVIYVDSTNPDDMDQWIKFGTVITTMR